MTLYNFNIILFLLLIYNNIKIKTISEYLLYSFKNNLNYLSLFFFFNIIGLPPLPIFFIKVNLLSLLLYKYNLYTYMFIIIFSIIIFYFYMNLFNMFNTITLSKKHLYTYTNSTFNNNFIIYIITSYVATTYTIFIFNSIYNKITLI